MLDSCSCLADLAARGGRIGRPCVPQHAGRPVPGSAQFGFKASRSQSPSRLMDEHRGSPSATPGKMVIHHPGEQKLVADAGSACRATAPSAAPHAEERQRRLGEIAVAMLIVASTSTGPITLGSAGGRAMMPGGRDADDARRLHVFCSSRPSSSRAPCARTAPSWRPIANTSTRMATLVVQPRGNATRATPSISSAMRIAGNESCTSATRMMSASVLPPAYPARGRARRRDHRERDRRHPPAARRGRRTRSRQDVAALVVGARAEGGRRSPHPPAGSNESDRLSVRSKGLWGAMSGAKTAGRARTRRTPRAIHRHRRVAEAQPTSPFHRGPRRALLRATRRTPRRGVAHPRPATRHASALVCAGERLRMQSPSSRRRPW